MLSLKIKDIADNIQIDENGKLCAIFKIGEYGKKKESRDVGITELTLQYYQRYLSTSHPDPTNKKAFLFVSKERSAMSRNFPISDDGLRADYVAFRDKTIPKLLKRPDIPDEDKKYLRFLKDTKKWHPYIMRHSSLDKLAHAPNINDYEFRRHAGWTKTSDMIEV